jgi:alpha-amylase/alpha-mannosidase (GH57 family)
VVPAELQNTRIIEVLGTGYYHPVLPVIRPADREEHLHRWRTIGGHLFAREHFPGFWPPELGFSMDLVPALCRHHYRYVIVDSEHVDPLTPMRWEELRYRPHFAQFGGEQIVVVVRYRELSNAQESDMDADWFISEVEARTQYCDFPPLVTTATNGENGGWFRNTTPGSNFWNSFHAGLMEKVRAGHAGGIRPTFISDYLERHGPHGWVTIAPGTWNTGTGFGQWTGSPAQQHALTRVGELSEAVHAARRNAIGAGNPDLYRHVEDALALVLRAETSCNFYWGETWVRRCHDDLDQATQHLEQAERLFH